MKVARSEDDLVVALATAPDLGFPYDRDQTDGIIAEPAGALASCVLPHHPTDISLDIAPGSTGATPHPRAAL